MCLYIRCDERVKVAEEDIIAYKILVKNGNVYTSFYREVESPLNTLLTTKLGRKYRGAIAKGFHTFLKESNARMMNGGYGTIVKAIIPKGSKYWEGEFCNSECYCSESIVYREL